MSWKAGSGIKFMSDQIIGMQQWFETPPGRYLLAWEQAEFDRAVGDIFGYHAVQLGLPELDTLQANRMPHKWLVLGHAPHAGDVERRTAARRREPPQLAEGAPVKPALVADFGALPFE